MKNKLWIRDHKYKQEYSRAIFVFIIWKHCWRLSVRLLSSRQFKTLYIGYASQRHDFQNKLFLFYMRLKFLLVLYWFITLSMHPCVKRVRIEVPHSLDYGRASSRDQQDLTIITQHRKCQKALKTEIHKTDRRRINYQLTDMMSYQHSRGILKAE